LASEGVAFTRAYAPFCGTPPSMAGLMTGRHPSFQGIGRWIPGVWYGFAHLKSPEEGPGLTDAVVTLAERLEAAGFATAGFHTNPHLAAHKNFDQGFGHYEEFVDWIETAQAHREHPLEATYPPAGVVSDGVGRWLEHRRRTRRPVFLWVHLMDPHSPYLPPPEWRERFSDPATRDLDDLAVNEVLYHVIFEQQHDTAKAAAYPDPETIDVPPERLLQHLRGLYRAETAYVDDAVGRIRRHLEEAGIWDDALVMVTSDHGEEFWEHGHVAHTRRSAMPEVLLRVPLVVRPPVSSPVAPRRVDDLVRLVDVAPTVLDLAAVGTSPGEMDGRSLRPLLEGVDDEPRLAYVSGVWWGIVADGRWKLRLEKPAWTGGDRRWKLFDLENDPLETNNLTYRLPERREQLRHEWGRFIEGLGPRGQAPPPDRHAGGTLDADTRERLEALGYVTEDVEN
jgi:arylsulfatase A-like enzyme